MIADFQIEMEINYNSVFMPLINKLFVMAKRRYSKSGAISTTPKI